MLKKTEYCKQRGYTPVTLTIAAQDIFDNKSRSINYLVSCQIGRSLGF
ncbi:hypothetical protein [Microcoleus sp. F4-D5]